MFDSGFWGESEWIKVDYYLVNVDIIVIGNWNCGRSVCFLFIIIRVVLFLFWGYKFFLFDSFYFVVVYLINGIL